MDQVLALRPFVPAKDLATSTRFYQALGFSKTMADANVAVLKLGSFSFILQDFNVSGSAAMLQLMVRDASAWWSQIDFAVLVRDFGVPPPTRPAMQPWGLKVGFIHDPSGVLWHVAEAPF